MARFVYYLFIKPLSYLPLRVLYFFSELIFLLVYFVIRYRRDVVTEQLNNSFPEKNSEEIKEIEVAFYKHFCDLLVESLKLFSISPTELNARMKITNPEVLSEYFHKDQNIILVGGHYNNWEMLAVCMNDQIQHQVVGIYTPLTNLYFEKKFSASRTRLGTILVSKYAVKEFFEKKQDSPVAIVFGADQSPQFVKDNTYWTRFLNQDTPVMFGTEKYAVKHNLPVFFMSVAKVKRGFYETTFTLLEENPITSEYCSITEQHTRLLEKLIQEQPAHYLWTHKRWKHKRNRIQ